MEIMQKAPLPFSVDIGRVINNLNSAFNPLHRDCQIDYKVAGAREGFICLLIVLPEGMTKAFISMLESMRGLFHCIDNKSRSAVAQERTYEPERITENRVAGGFSPPAPTPPGMRVRTGRFDRITGP